MLLSALTNTKIQLTMMSRCLRCLTLQLSRALSPNFIASPERDLQYPATCTSSTRDAKHKKFTLRRFLCGERVVKACYVL